MCYWFLQELLKVHVQGYPSKEQWQSLNTNFHGVLFRESIYTLCFLVSIIDWLIEAWYWYSGWSLDFPCKALATVIGIPIRLRVCWQNWSTSSLQTMSMLTVSMLAFSSSAPKQPPDTRSCCCCGCGFLTVVLLTYLSVSRAVELWFTHTVLLQTCLTHVC